MAKNKTSYWLYGCGIGCGVILLLVVLLISGGALFMRDTMSGFEKALESRQKIEERYGNPDDFIPPAEGSIAPDRMESFLFIRSTMQPYREEIAGFFSSLPNRDRAQELEEKPFLEKMGFVWKITRSAMGLGADLGHFFEARNQALLEAGMGMGEYTYIYVLAYYSWLQHQPGEGPGEEHGAGMAQAGGRVRRTIRAIMKNQLAAIGDAGDPTWQAQLNEEIELLQNDMRRVPWQDGLPSPILQSLEPYRKRLEETYHPITNAFELSRTRRSSGFGIQTD